METTAIKPKIRFHWISTLDPDQVVVKIQEIFSQKGDDLTIKVERHHIKIGITPEKQIFWSPLLTINIYESEEGTEIRGHYGPKPDVWLGFWFGYIFLGFVTFFAGIYVLSQSSLGNFSYFIYLLPFSIGGFVVLYLGHNFGKKMARPQINQIQGQLESAIFDETHSVVNED
jgi:hypothetical protein